jgi:hypothetical protein
MSTCHALGSLAAASLSPPAGRAGADRNDQNQFSFGILDFFIGICLLFFDSAQDDVALSTFARSM